MLKILQARLQQYVNCELPDVQAGFRKGRGTRDQIANICWIIGKTREFQKNIYFCFTDYAESFDCVDHNCGKFLKRWEYQTTLPASWEICMQIKKQVRTGHGTADWFQIRKGVCQSYIAEYIMRNAGLVEEQAGIRLPGQISITSDTQMIPSLWQKAKN